MKRLLVPVAHVNSSLKVIDYLIHRSICEKNIAACLLHVEEPLTQWSALVGKYSRRYQTKASDQLFGEMLDRLDQYGIDHCAYVRTGGVVFTILDTAEELDCHEIVMPPPAGGVGQILSRNIVRHVMKRQRKVPVTLVR